MRIAFAGAGGVGAYFGACLADGGMDVCLIARGAHAAVMRHAGVRILENGRERQVRIPVIDTGDPTQLAELRAVDWLFFTCKSQHTRALAEQLRPHVDPRTRIVSLQNGVDNPALLEGLFRRPVIGGMSIRFAAHVLAPGQLEVRGQGYLVLGDFPTGVSPELQRWAEAARRAQVDVRVSEDIRRELWKKLVINNGVNPLSALLQRDCAYVVHHPMTAPLVRTLMQETALAARADEVYLSEADVEEMHAVIANLQPIKSSMQVDAEKGRELELDAIAGVVMERVRRLQQKAPVTETLYRLLRVREQAAREEITREPPV